MAMNQQQRRRAQRLRLKRDGDAKRGIPPRPLMPKESTWLAWYDANVGPSPLRPKKPTSGAPDEELEPEAPDEDLEPEPDAPREAFAEEELEDQQPDEPEAPERERPRWIDARTLDGHAERRRAELAPFVAKIHALECTNEALRSAVNVQIAGGQMLERACVIALDLAAEMKNERGGLVQQLVDTIAALADVQQQRVEDLQQPAEPSKKGIKAKDVTDELGKRMIDGIFPPKPEKPEPVTTPPPEPEPTT